MTHPSPSDDFIRELTIAQPRLFPFAVALVGNTDAAGDVMQESNITLCRQWQDYQPGTPFMAWACTVVRYKVLEYRRAARRDAVIFNGQLLDDLADEAEQVTATESAHSTDLDACLDKLEPRQRELIRQRYESGLSVQDIAQRQGRSHRGLAVTLFRLRQWLLNCMQRAQAGRQA